MFTRAELEAIEQDRLTHGPVVGGHPDLYSVVGGYPGLYFTAYPQHAFRTPSSEEYIRVTRALRLAADNGIKFWCSAEWAAGWSGRESYFAPYLHGAQFEPISEDEFNRIVQESSSELIAPLSLSLHAPNGFVGAILMYSIKSDFIVSLVAEYDDEFIHHFWESTA
ncbi:MAG: hypothetical protein QM766_07155 [Burkholderiaceae bacterium]